MLGQIFKFSLKLVELLMYRKNKNLFQDNEKADT